MKIKIHPFRRKEQKRYTSCCTIPQSKIGDFCQLPLHKGALGAPAPVQKITPAVEIHPQPGNILLIILR